VTARRARTKHDDTTMAPDSEDLRSPCVKRCRLDPATDICTGCRRTVGEITHWSRMSRERRRKVLARIAESVAPAAD